MRKHRFTIVGEMLSSLLRRVLAVPVSVLFIGCATIDRQFAHSEQDRAGLTTGTRGETCCVMAKGTPKQTALVQAATGLLGRSSIRLNGRSYSSDCSGLVRAVYAMQQIDLYGGLGDLDGGNGVGRIYTHVMQHGSIHYGPAVRPGDVVFFHNTWDFNGDSLPNDPLTHVGVVEQVERDGTVTFVSWVSSGVERYRMNLQRPDTHKAGNGRILNDYLRRRKADDHPTTRYLAGQLFAAFGTLLR
ncbi:MAG: CHAP domain-containing protein [Nitrospira sp.]|nr:CHAP domain-containing protein [Nitrospira sp.]